MPGGIGNWEQAEKPEIGDNLGTYIHEGDLVCLKLVTLASAGCHGLSSSCTTDRPLPLLNCNMRHLLLLVLVSDSAINLRRRYDDPLGAFPPCLHSLGRVGSLAIRRIDSQVWI